MAETLPFLTKFRHKQEGLSGDPGGSSDSIQSFPPLSGFNTLLDDIAHQQLIGYRPQGQTIFVTTTSYPGTPDIRFCLTPWVGHYLAVQCMMGTIAGAGTLDIKVEVEAPASTKVNVFNLTTSGAASAQNGTTDLSSVSGQDVRGMDGFLNLYLKVSAGGTTGALYGLTAWQGENVSSNPHKLIG